MSPQFTLTAINVWPIVKVFLYSAASAVITTAIVMLESAEVPAQFLLLVPVANTVLYALKEFFTVRF